MTDNVQPKVQGEGNYEAGRHYDKAAREFVESGRVDDAAAAAAPHDAQDAAEMAAAEREGRSHSKGEALADRGSTQPAAGADPKPPPQKDIAGQPTPRSR